MKNRKINLGSERGQAIILITFAIIGLIGIIGLAVDGGLAYSDRRNAQNAADSAAMAAALAHVRGGDMEEIALGITSKNGYEEVTITSVASPSGCPEGSTNNKDITVEIVSKIDTTFATVVGIRQMTNMVTATSRACGVYIPPLFGGNAIVGLNPDVDDCAFNSDTGSAIWTITGGGIFSNGCAVGKGNVTLDTDPYQCVSALEKPSADDFNNICSGTIIPYDQTYTDSIMPPNPCGSGGIGKPQPAITIGEGGAKNSVLLQDGVYCITNFDAYDSAEITLKNATLYVTDDVFKLQFSGGGGFSGTPTETGTYSNYFLVIEPTNHNKCTDFQSNTDQVINYRGNSGGDIPFGTVLAPTACVDLRGNGAATVNGQVIGYTVSANGDAGATIHYVENQNHREPMDPTLQMLK